MRLVLASNNAKKLIELQALFAAVPVHLEAQGTLQISEADEPHGTFVENALAKARHAASQARGAAIADDSGLCVDALGGEPGVVSAHYATIARDSNDDREAHRRRQDAANTALLLQRMHGQQDRHARFTSTLVALRHARDPEPLIAVGRWELEVMQEPRGSGGFGYDPVVWVPTHGCSVAELDASVKNAISHRALAAQQLGTLMREVWRLP
jgi:XTP/dITP diphosphohydrolase